MAELALGLTKTVLEGAVSRVQSAIEEEAKLKETVQQDLVFITGEFQMMQSFLKVATRERARNEVVRTWVRQLRDLAFDVEDCVEFVVHLDNKGSPMVGWWRRVVPSSCLAPPRPLDEAAAEIKLLKARVEDVSQRNTRYNLLISDYAGSGTTSKVADTAPLPAAANTSAEAFQILRQVWRDETYRFLGVGSLRDLIAGGGEGDKEKELQVISLWGSENLEAISYIINKAYHDPEIYRGFQRRARVKLTRPLNLEELLNSLLAQLLFFVGSSHQATNKGLAGAAELMQQVTKEARYLVVLEQVSDAAEWDAIKAYLPDNKNGSRIVVSTQHLGIALYCTGEPYLVSELRQFSDGRPSICAFYRKVAGSRRSDMDELKWQIKHGGVISVCGDAPKNSVMVKRLYRSIMLHREELRFRVQSWVPVVSHPLDLSDFSRRLLLDLDHGFYDGGLKEMYNVFPSDEGVRFVCSMENLSNEKKSSMLEEVIETCRMLLRQHSYLVVIDGLQSMDEWDTIKSTFLAKPPKCCVVVVTDNLGVAEYCVDGNRDRLVQVREVDLQGKAQGRIFSCRREEAIFWIRGHFDYSLDKSWREIMKRVNNKPWLPEYRPNVVVSVWGIAGVGKSAHVRCAFYRNMIFGPDFDNYLWVDVPHPFSLLELSRRLLLEFHSDNPAAKETAIVAITEGQDPIQACRECLRQQHAKWLLVLDGLQSTDDWDSIKAAFCLSEATSGSRIVVITNEQNVAIYCVDFFFQVINIKGLQAKDALGLFTQKMDKHRCLSDADMETSKHVISKCGGLPKVIVSIAEYYNSNKRIDLKTINDKFMVILMYSVPSLNGLFSWMQSYLETCEDELKPCIFYLPVFPIDHDIRRRRLVRRWIAEGYCRDRLSRTAEKDGEGLLYMLVTRSIIQKQPSSKSSQYRVNGFFHEYITSRPMEDNLVLALEGPCTPNSERVGQHLTIRSSWDRDMTVFRGTDFSRLRSFTVFGKCRRSMFDSTNTKMPHVRVLDLEDASGVTDDCLEGIVDLLPRLKFLSLRGCREITRLPRSVSGLRQLQTLDVRYTSVTTLPEAILKLRKLQYVRAGTARSVPWDECGTMVPCQPATEEEEAVASSTAPDEDSTTAPAAPMAAEEGATTRVAEVPLIPAREATTAATAAPRSRTYSLIPSWLSRLYRRGTLDNTNGGVEVPAGIGNLTSLHTFGIANVGAGKAAILKELHKLSQLHRLGVSGVNPDNIHELFSSISGLSHLESLTVRLDKNKQGFIASLDDTIDAPPKTLKNLMLHGHVRLVPGSWIKKQDLLDYGEKVDLEMTIESQRDMHVIFEELMVGVGRHLDGRLRRLCVKPIQDGELRIESTDQRYVHIEVLEIVCTSDLQVTIGEGVFIHVLKVHCSIGSSLRLSGLQTKTALKEVWLKGSYSDALKQDLQRQLATHYNPKPVLKLLQPHSS